MIRRVPQFAHKPTAVIVAAVFGAAALLAATPVVASDDDPVIDERYLEDRVSNDALLSENRQSVDATSRRIEQAAVELDSLVSTAAELQQRIALLDSEIAAVQADYQHELDAQAEAIRNAARLRDEVADAEIELEAWRRLVTERAVAAYITPQRTPSIVPYLRSRSITELHRKMTLLAVIAENDADALAGLEHAREALADRLGEQDYREALANEARRRSAESRAALAAKRSEQADLQAELDARIAGQTAEIEALEAARAELQRIIATREARFRAEAEQRAAWRADCAAGRRPVTDAGVAVDCATLDEPLAPSSMTWPAAGTVSSEFGPRWGRMHEGIDIAAPTGTTLWAAEDGMVFFAGWLGGYGNTTIIDHGGGVVSLYGHQDSIWVVDGQHVVRGEGIGAMGTTGNSTGPHLHFETLVGGQPVDPRQFLG